MGITRSTPSITLLTLVKMYEKKDIIVPVWQRENDVWTPKERGEFKHYVMQLIKQSQKRGQAETLPTNIHICLLTNEHSPIIKNLMDGLQRTSSLYDLWQELKKKYGLDEAAEMMDSVYVIMFNVEYKDEEEAKVAFTNINKGTQMTAFEKTATIRTRMNMPERWKEEFFTELYKAVDSAYAGMGVRITNTRKNKHMRRYDAHALFLRYATGNKTLETYRTKFEPGAKNENHIDTKLIEYLEEIGIEEAKKIIPLLKRRLDECNEHTRPIWNKLITENNYWGKNIRSVTTVVLSNLWHLNIYRINTKTPVDRMDNFVQELLKACRGRVQVITSTDGEHGSQSIQLHPGDLAKMTVLQIGLDVFFDENLKPSLKRQKQSTAQLPPGMENAHLNPYARNLDGDDGKVTALDAISNRSQGATEIKIDENILETETPLLMENEE